MKSALINLSVDIQHYLLILKIRWKQWASINFWDNPRTDVYKQAKIVGRKIVDHGGLEPASFGLQV